MGKEKAGGFPSGNHNSMPNSGANAQVTSATDEEKRAAVQLHWAILTSIALMLVIVTGFGLGKSLFILYLLFYVIQLEMWPLFPSGPLDGWPSI
ncbi:unnamed protein product [Protopolystoma xenopodis]|uniref:Uncharacterized protein n=1 Tax=Protopolystoma xenopodis TaxID=117903 RepID=A0A448X9C1_9PLAT|nr:unnamed protein product [Protopolystoma xenopodis]